MNSDVKREVAHMEDIGWERVSSNGGHIKMRHPEHGEFVLSFSPSDRRWRANHRSTLARAMGITQRALLVQMGIAQTKSKRGKRGGRRRGRPKRTRPETTYQERRIVALRGIIDRLIDRRRERLRSGVLAGPSDGMKVQAEIHALEEKRRELDLNPPEDEIAPELIARAEHALRTAA